jgi:ABC-type dipeptide/oligopeptide/nickel transport system permease subunit
MNNSELNKDVYEQENQKKEDLQKNSKKNVINLFKSPLILIGLIITIILIIISIFPNIITPYSIEETLSVYAGSWNPPSNDHPLGTAKFGRDVLALLIYSLRPSLLVPIFITLIAFIGGIFFWYLDTQRKLIRNVVICAFLILFFVAYWFIQFFWGFNIVFTEIMILGFLFMFLVFFLIFNRNKDLKSTLKKFLIYFPLVLVITILIIEFQAFLGNDDGLIHLGSQISDGRVYIDSNPFAFVSPLLTLIIMILGFLFLYLGLKKYIPAK